MSVKFTNIEMEWTDDGARVVTSIALPCPRCHVSVTPGVEHLCGDMIPKPAKGPRKKRAK